MMPLQIYYRWKEAESSKNELNQKLHFAKKRTKPESKNVQEHEHFTLLRLTKFKYQPNDN